MVLLTPTSAISISEL